MDVVDGRAHVGRAPFEEHLAVMPRRPIHDRQPHVSQLGRAVWEIETSRRVKVGTEHDAELGLGGERDAQLHGRHEPAWQWHARQAEHGLLGKVAVRHVHGHAHSVRPTQQSH